MRRFLRILPSVLVAAPVALGQTFFFSDGRKASLSEVRVADGQVYVSLVSNGKIVGERGLPIESIVRLDWPEPGELVRARKALTDGKPDEALKLAASVLSSQERLRDILGSWWGQAMLLRIESLARLDQEADAELAIEQLRGVKTAAHLADRGELLLVVALIDSNQTERARERLQLIEPAGADQSIRARIDLATGRLLSAEGRTEAALLAYLRVPVLHSVERELQPAALLGAATCYRALGEAVRADALLAALAEKYPDTREARDARAAQAGD